MRSIHLNTKVKKEELEKYMAIGDIKPYSFQSNGKNLKGCILKTFTTCKQENDPLFLYMFPGEGGNGEWADPNNGFITHQMSYIMSIKKHPGMTIIMPDLFYGANRICEAQEITVYIKDIVEHFEGKGAWDNQESYKRRAVAGLCLGALSALKCALHWEKGTGDNIEKFFSAGIFSPANEAENGRWINGIPNFRFIHPEKHRLYLSCGTKDYKKCHADRYNNHFNKNKSPVNDFVEIIDGYHDFYAFNTSFSDFMFGEIFAHEYYTNINNPETYL